MSVTRTGQRETWELNCDADGCDEFIEVDLDESTGVGQFAALEEIERLAAGWSLSHTGQFCENHAPAEETS